MKTFVYLFTGMVMVMFLTGCFDRSPMDPNIPAALQAERGKSGLEYSSARKTRDLVNDLFDELAGQDEKLERIKQEQLSLIDLLEQERNALILSDGKSEEYYSAARAHARSIQDSTLANQMHTLINNSETSWQDKMKSKNALAKKLDKNRRELIDELHALKIRLTIPQIQDDQIKASPSPDSAHTLIKDAAILAAAMRKY